MKHALIYSLVFLVATTGLAQRNDSPEFYLRMNRKKIDVLLRAADFQPQDTIADIGASEGWLDVAFGIYKDSLHFYLENIDSTNIKNERLEKTIKDFAQVKGSQITCHYTFSFGSEKNTDLPSNYFNKVLLVDTYHHFSFRKEMLTDIKRILKPKGKLIIYEVLARKEGDIYKPCRTMIYTKDQIVSYICSNGFNLSHIFKTVNSNGKRVRVFTFNKV
jgi:ubiquinone/menaquinone biosynthesis C-methylase UbiE